MAEYQAPWRPQFDGSPHATDNCGPTGVGRLAKRFRKGRTPTTHVDSWNSSIRKQGDGTGWISQRPTMSERIRQWIINNQPSVGWGTTLPQNLAAIKALWGVDGKRVGYRFNVAWSDLVAYVLDGGCAVRIVYKYVHAYPKKDGCRTFNGGHIIFVQDRRFCQKHDRYEFLVADSLADHRFGWIPQGSQWWPAKLLRRAATEGGVHGAEFAFVRD